MDARERRAEIIRAADEAAGYDEGTGMLDVDVHSIAGYMPGHGSEDSGRKGQEAYRAALEENAREIRVLEDQREVESGRDNLWYWDLAELWRGIWQDGNTVTLGLKSLAHNADLAHAASAEAAAPEEEAGQMMLEAYMRRKRAATAATSRSACTVGGVLERTLGDVSEKEGPDGKWRLVPGAARASGRPCGSRSRTRRWRAARSCWARTSRPWESTCVARA